MSWHDAAKGLRGIAKIPAGILTFQRAGHAPGYPTRIDSARGARLVDADGKNYLDWVMGKGAVTLGHGREEVDRAAFERARRGVLLPGLTIEQERLADWLAAHVLGIEQTLFAKNGSDAIAIAIKIARVHTGRDWILSAGYHGWDERVSGEAKLEPGRSVADFAYDLDALERVLERHGERTAAVIVTPEPAFLDAAWLVRAQALARASGALLVVDEVRCGMRLGPGGAHAPAAVTPDLVAMSKGLANGYPLAILGGSARVMEAAEKTYVFGTYYGEGVSLAAACAATEIAISEDVAGAVARAGQALIDGLRDRLAPHAAIAIGPPSMPTILFEHPADELAFYDAAVRAGVLFFQDDAQCPSLAHDEAIVQETLRALSAVVDSLPERAERELSRAAIDRYAARRGIAAGLARLDH